MAKDYTDYVCVVFGGGPRMRHTEHIRQVKGDPDIAQFPYNGNFYEFDKNEAMPIKGYKHLKPWGLWTWKRPLYSLRELFRSKRVAGMLFEEPPYGPAQEFIEVRRPKAFSCIKCGYRTDKVKAIKMHIMAKHKEKQVGKFARVEYELVKTAKPKTPLLVKPMHINKIKQPSGRKVDDPEPSTPSAPHPLLMSMGLYDSIDPTQPTFPPVTDMVSPRVLKAIIDRPQVRRAYKSFKFGTLVAISQKWWIWLVVAVVGIMLLLVATGNFRMAM